MRRWSFLAIVVLVAAFLAACSCGDDDDSSSSGGSSDDDDNDDDNDGDDDDASPLPADLVAPDDITYLGAFRLPGEEERPHTFEYGGAAMTFNPDGDPSGPADGYAGSLFVMGHDRVLVDVPNGNQTAEIDIVAPVVADDLAALPTAGFLQDFAEVAGDWFDDYQEIPRAGLLYLDHPSTGPLVHLAMGQHLQDALPTHAVFSPDVSDPQPQGGWFVGDASPYSINGYLIEIPSDWADAYSSGRVIATGRYRDGGWSGKGPALFAYVPWMNDEGALYASGATLPATTLLQYVSSEVDELPTSGALENYQHADEWEGGAWITTTSGKTAVLFAGTKGVGAKYWYGYINPAGPEHPCVEVELVDQFTTCWTAEGEPCPDEDLHGCEGATSNRGWWSSRFEAQILLYNPDDLRQVATGSASPASPQPYASFSIDDYLFLNPAGIEPDMLGTGAMRRYRIGETAYDRAAGRLYVLELFADGAKPVVHVFGVAP